MTRQDARRSLAVSKACPSRDRRVSNGDGVKPVPVHYLPNKPSGVPRVDDRRVLNAMFIGAQDASLSPRQAIRYDLSDGRKLDVVDPRGALLGG